MDGTTFSRRVKSGRCARHEPRWKQRPRAPAGLAVGLADGVPPHRRAFGAARRHEPRPRQRPEVPPKLFFFLFFFVVVVVIVIVVVVVILLLLCIAVAIKVEFGLF